MKQFRIPTKYLTHWPLGDNNIAVTRSEIKQLADEIGKPQKEVLSEFAEIDVSVSRAPMYRKAVVLRGNIYEILCMPEFVTGTPCNMFYVHPEGSGLPLIQMFGLPKDQHPIREAFDIAEANFIQDYPKYNHEWHAIA